MTENVSYYTSIHPVDENIAHNLSALKMLKQEPAASLTCLNKQIVLFSRPRQLEPLPLTTKTQGPLLIKDCM